jgi:hypothetical protein
MTFLRVLQVIKLCQKNDLFVFRGDLSKIGYPLLRKSPGLGECLLPDETGAISSGRRPLPVWRHIFSARAFVVEATYFYPGGKTPIFSFYFYFAF